jgi:glycine oxidase
VTASAKRAQRGAAERSTGGRGRAPAGTRLPDAIVVGGGVVGCAAAFALAREGLRVVLLERDGIASHASGAAAGMLTPLAESPPRGPLFAFGLRSLGMFPALAAELRERSGIDPEYEASGLLRVAASEAEAAELRELVRAHAAEGLAWLDPAALREAEPRLAGVLHGGVASSREGHVRSPLLARAFAAAAEAAGARVETGVAAVALRREGGRVVAVETARGLRAAGRVVLCPGSFGADLLASIGAERFAPIEPVRGQIVTLAAAGALPRTILWRGSLYLVPKRDGSLVVGSTEERAGFDCRVTAAGIAWLLREATALVPALGEWSFREAYAGLRPATRDGLPVIGPLPGVEGLFLAAGHFRKGVLLSPATAALVVDWALGRTSPDEARAFLPARFA